MFVKLENWTTLSLFLPWGNIKNYFFLVYMVLRKRFPKASYGCKTKGATRWSSMRMNNGDLLELINITRALGKEQIWVPNSIAVCRTPVNMNSVKWPCSPWVLVLSYPDRAHARCSGGHGHHSCRGCSCLVAQFTFYKTWWYANMRKIVLSGGIFEVYLAFALGCKSTTYIFWTI